MSDVPDEPQPMRDEGDRSPTAPDLESVVAAEVDEHLAAREAAPAESEAPEAPDAPDAADGEEDGAPSDPEATPGEGEDRPDAEADDGGKSGKKRKRKSKAQRAAEQAPSPGEVRARIGTTAEAALAYVDDPDPRLARLPRPVREQLIAELPAVTAAALLGPAALARHFVASAATGRYRDLFALWQLFSRYPDACKPELSERGTALERGRRNLRLATELGLLGRADRVAEDVAVAEGLIWQWLREILHAHPKAVAERPAVAAALLAREPDTELPVPEQPTPRWLSEAAAVKQREELPAALEAALQANVHRLPSTIATLRLAAIHYPDRVPSLVDAVDLDAPDVEAFLAWARDHGSADRLIGRIRDRVNAAAARDRAEGLARWDEWRRRGVDLPLPSAITEAGLDGLDLTRPETAHLAAALERQGGDVAMQQRLDDLAASNRQLAEKAYEAAVCAGLDVSLPAALEHNPIVKDGTRCPRCRAWTWVRPGHEDRCPRTETAPQADHSPSEAFELAAAESSERT